MVRLLGVAADTAGIAAVIVTTRGQMLASWADTLARFALAALLRQHLDQPVNVINAALVAEERQIELKTLIAADHGEDRLAIEIERPEGPCRVEGTIYGDGLPRVTHLDGYWMDMVATGHLVVLTNTDEPGRIGLVGRLFGDAGINIAEMVIGRRRGAAGPRAVAMMIIKLDQAPPPAILQALRQAPGILGVAAVTLPHADHVEEGGRDTATRAEAGRTNIDTGRANIEGRT
jgi:D-3-phosphoglycerate dehydrogenase